MSPRQWLLLVAGLAVAGAVLAAVGLPGTLWSTLMGSADRWRAGFFALGHASPVMEADTLGADDPVPQDLLLRLSAENAELRRRIREYDAVQAEVGTSMSTEDLLRARVVARSADDGRHFIEIDRGALDGVLAGSPVLVGWTLVGVVRGERAHRSLVQLLTDRQSRVAVSMYSPGLVSGDDVGSDIPLAEGVVAGVGERYHLQVIHVEARSAVQIVEGMHVVTSGLDEKVPFGLAVGEVVEARRRPDSDLWDVVVQPHRPWGSYPTVLVLRDPAAASPRQQR